MLPTEQAQTLSTAVEELAHSLPVRVLEIDLGQPLPILSSFNEKTRQRYRQALCLVRLHDYPLGQVHLTFTQDTLFAHDYVEQLWHELSKHILAHLQQDGLSAIEMLSTEGLASVQQPGCWQEREEFYARAPFASIVISTHNRADQLARCLPRLLAQHYPDYEIIIVDNAPSNEETAELVQQTYGQCANLRYIREDRAGLSVGLNRGIVEARSDFVAFTDDDVQVDQYWLLQLMRAFERADDVMCVTGLVLPQELETAPQIWFEEFSGFSKGFQARLFNMTTRRTAEPLYPYTAGGFGTGANMAFRATFLKHVKGFDTALQTGMDIAAFFQVVKRGHTLIYEPGALAHHTHRREYVALQEQLYTYGMALTAYLTKSMIDRPYLLFDFLSKIPYGLFYALSSHSPRNAKKSPAYPKALTNAERKGSLIGPFIYLYKRWKRVPFPQSLAQTARKNGVS